MQATYKTMNFPKDKYLVDIHHHLDGAYSSKLLEKIATRKGKRLIENFQQKLMEYKDLTEFVEKWGMFSPIYTGDAEAVEELTYDCIRREADIGVAYLETRMCTFLLSDQSVYYEPIDNFIPTITTQKEALEVVKKAVHRAMEDFPIQVKIILVAVRNMHQFNAELTELLTENDELVVGVDTASDEIAPMCDEELQSLIKLYNRAKECKLGRTFHAGESGRTENIVKAVEVFGADRIGHGYALINDPGLAQRLKEKDIHFELCPISSVTIPKSDYFKDMKTTFNWFFDQDLNVSLNSDDSMFFQCVDASIEHCKTNFQLENQKILKALLNAARSSFLKPKDQEALVDHIKKYFPHSN